VNRDVRGLLDAARASGADVRRTRNGHWQVRVRGGGIVVVPSTPSCPRSVLNARALLRRLGVAV
jgi:hypothetical protein